MRTGFFIAASVFVACGGAAATTDATTVVVPPQPPQPIATTTAPIAERDAGAPIAQEKTFACSGGERFEIGTRSYCAYTDALSWDGAEARCVENGGHLATIDSRVTSDALKTALASPAGLPRAAWIGLEQKKVGAKKEWRWSTSGSAVKSARWSKGEPNDFYGDGSESCAEWLVSDGKWNDTRCDLRLPVICDLPANADCGVQYKVTAAGRQYCLETPLRRFAEAKKACQQRGGQLAEPDGEISDKLKEGFGARFPVTRFWIGLNDANDEGIFHWTSGARGDFRAWARGEPNDYSDEDCVEVYADTWLWNDFDCAAPKASLCESAPKKK